jgi:hypothetical protein
MSVLPIYGLYLDCDLEELLKQSPDRRHVSISHGRLTSNPVDDLSRHLTGTYPDLAASSTGGQRLGGDVTALTLYPLWQLRDLIISAAPAPSPPMKTANKANTRKLARRLLYALCLRRNKEEKRVWPVLKTHFCGPQLAGEEVVEEVVDILIHMDLIDEIHNFRHQGPVLVSATGGHHLDRRLRADRLTRIKRSATPHAAAGRTSVGTVL